MLLRQVKVAEQGVAVTSQFLAGSTSALEAQNSVTLLKNLPISALITGAKGTGKKTLAISTFQNSPVIEGGNFEELLATLPDCNDIIVTSFEKIPNYDVLLEALDVHKTRIIATTSIELSEKLIKQFFAISIHLLPLQERMEDVKLISKKILEKNSELLAGIGYDEIKDFSLDLSQNAHSLERSIISQALFKTLDIKELMFMLEKTLERTIEGTNAYRDNLYLFDVPIIRAGLKRYKSQLKLSEVLGLNRNTLRKKILQYNKELNNE